MTLNNIRTTLNKASQRKYAVGAFNVINLNFLDAVFDAAENTSSPVIIYIAEIRFPYLQLEHIMSVIKAITPDKKYDIVVNLDHGTSMEAIKRATANGFPSIMFDDSQLPFEENVLQIRKTVETCHLWISLFMQSWVLLVGRKAAG